jgi:hypothetical protein
MEKEKHKNKIKVALSAQPQHPEEKLNANS